ncbi:type II toxin-antitoxin system PrlF family antitoxin [Pseudomonas baetica]|uniref:type II toxin-antitoxin system PrlF family antitoxin n=1 Tax=Pseudomonas baetica TaxID=674054 RepID=UPI003EEBAB5E
MNYSDPTPSTPTGHSRSEPECIDDSENDQVLFKFLSLLEDDILSNPEKLIAFDSTLLARLDSLIGGLDVDINSPLSADDE